MFFTTEIYEQNHGKKPRGMGAWAWRIGGKMVWCGKDGKTGETSDEAGVCLYSESRKTAFDYAAARGFMGIHLLS